MLTYSRNTTDSIASTEETVNFALRHGLVTEGRGADALRRIDCGGCAAQSFPDADPALAQLAADQIAFLFLFDDAYAEGSHRLDPLGYWQQMQPYLALVKGTSFGPSTPHASALRELVTRATAAAPSDWRDRYANSFEHYCHGCREEATARQGHTRLSWEAYLELRRGSIGMSPMFDLMEQVDGAFLTAEEWSSPVGLRLRHLGADLSALVNDIASLEKETQVGDVCNAVVVLQAEHACSEEQALEKVAELHNGLLAELYALEARLGALTGQALARYARSITQWVNGHYAWILSSRRYRQQAAGGPAWATLSGIRTLEPREAPAALAS